MMKTNSKPIIHVLVCLSVLITATLTCNLFLPISPVIAVALKFEGSPALTVYIGNPQNNIFWLPAGVYYIEAMDSDGVVYKGWWEVVDPASNGGDTVALSQRVRGDGQSDEAIAAQLQTLAEFMITVDLTRLTYLEIATNGFQSSFKDSMDVIQMSDGDPFYANLQEIADMKEPVFAAIQALEARAQQAGSDLQPDSAGGLAGRVLPRPRPGVWDKLVNLFSFKNEEDEKAILEIVTVSAAMTPEEKAEAFSWLEKERVGGAQNYDEFLQLLQDGSLEDLTGIRSDLYTGPPYQDVYQTVFPDSNRPGGENLHRAGVELVRRGAELEFEIIKETLTAAFPEIQQGFEYADKADQWAQFVSNMYLDPLGTLQEMALDEIKDGIQDRIELDLLSVVPNLDEETAEQLAERLTDEIMDTQPDLATALAEIQNGGETSRTDALTQAAAQAGPGEAGSGQEAGEDTGASDFDPVKCDASAYVTWEEQVTRSEINEFGTEICDYKITFRNSHDQATIWVVAYEHEMDVWQDLDEGEWGLICTLEPGESYEWIGWYSYSHDPDAIGPTMTMLEGAAAIFKEPDCEALRADEGILISIASELPLECKK